MNLCIELAKEGVPEAYPNPLVGCVIVHDNTIIGKGYHEQFGEAHAEVNAINSVGNKNLLKDSTLYVTLEPCSHTGKTPPCSDFILAHQIPKVVIGSLDTFSKVNGQGIERLKSSGVDVVCSVLEHECRAINSRFFTFHEKKRPYILLKWAQSADGYIAPPNQEKPFWLTAKDAKQLVHQWRSEESAILVGKNTVIKDNPLLTSREVKGKNPIRLVIDKSLSLTNDFNVFNTDAQTYIINETIEDKNHLKVNFESFLPSLMSELHAKNIQSVIVEGGKQTLNAFISTNCWDEARVFTSNKQLGGGMTAPIFEKHSFKTIALDNDSLSFYLNI